jgi:hypothetical protein
VTSSTDSYVKVSGSNNVVKTSNKSGMLTFTSDSFKLNDIVSAVVIYQNGTNVVSQSGTFTVSAEAAVSELSIKEGVYTANGKAVSLTEDYAIAGGAYVLVSAKDQYGAAVETLNWTTGTSQNAYVQIAGGLTNLVLDSTTTTTVTVDGVDYAGIKLGVDTGKALAAGTATLIVISKGTGVTAQSNVTVADGVKVDTISIDVPSDIIGGEDNELGYTAVDTYGNKVTSVSALAAVNGIGTTPVAGSIYVKRDTTSGEAKLYYTAASNTGTTNAYDVEVLTTATYKSTQVNFSIKPDAVPYAITGTNKLTTGSLTNDALDVTPANIKVVDQYNRSIDVSSPYEIVASVDGADNAGTGVSTGTTLSDNTSFAMSGNGSTKVVFTLKNGTTNVSTYKVTFTAVSADDIKTYEVTDFKTPINMGPKASTS